MSHHRRLRITGAAVAAVLAIPLALSAGPASAAQHGPAAVTAQPDYRTPMGPDGLPVLPAPPEPPAGLPTEPNAYQSPNALLSALARQLIVNARTTAGTLLGRHTAVPAPPQAVTWGGHGSASALVLYDTTNTWGFLGELYAMAAGNLASHFGQITAEPVADYVSGQVNDYTATIYLGSTYNEPIPAAFLNDVLSTARPVIWAGDNIWQLTGSEGSAADTGFESVYGWDPSSSYFDSTDNPPSVSYKGQTFTRNAANGADLLAPHITNPSLVTVLAQANCTGSGGPVNCAPIAQSSGTSFPWAIRSSNLTYVGEVPFSYISETDRYVAFSDLLFPALNPAATPSHLALVRLEDVNATSSPAQIDAITSYLSSQGVPFSINVIPQYLDPNGVNNNGVPVSESIGQSPSVVAALRNAKAHGGTLIQEGYTHQYSNVANPYDAVSGDDAEFYTAQCATTPNPPYTVDAPCQNSDWVIWRGPVPGDSGSWALGRVQAGRALFAAAGLTPPAIWVTPHYFASVADYRAIDSVIKTRYEREIFASGQLSGQPLNYGEIFGQFFPYQVHDVYGEQIIPENLGDYEPAASNNNPARTAADIIANARVNLAVTQGTASFFFNPSDPLSQLQAIVSGIKSLGYTFVSPTSLPG
jgi:uncharacterized protein YdaL